MMKWLSDWKNRPRSEWRELTLACLLLGLLLVSL